MKFKLHRNFFFIAFFDSLLIVASLYLAFVMRYDYGLSEYNRQCFYWMISAFIITKFVLFYIFDLYKGMWRYTSTRDLFNVLKACTLSSLLLIFFVLLVIGGFQSILASMCFV